MKAFLHRLKHRVWPELWKAKPGIAFVLGFLVAAWLAARVGDFLQRGLADKVRYFGTWLQVFGVALVAYGVTTRRREFGLPNVFEAMLARLAAVRDSFKSESHVALTGVGALGIAGSAAVLGRSLVGGTVEQRLDHIERVITELQKEAHEREQRLEAKVTAVRSALEAEVRQRNDSVKEVQLKIDNLAVGDLHWEAVGLWWLLVATIATCIPDGVAWMLLTLGF